MNPNCDTKNIERIGVNAVSLAFEKLGWTFRERQHSDFGIDADVEQKIDGDRTNCHIALQIKSGDSYIKVKKNGKITFSIDPFHYDYWLQSDRPVLILLYDYDSEKIYWEQVRLAIMQQSVKYKKIEINPTKILDESCVEELNDIVSTYVKHNICNIEKEYIDYEYSISCIREYVNSVKELVNRFMDFENKIKSHFISPKVDIMCLQFDVFGGDIQRHIEFDYELFHKAFCYIAYLTYKLDSEVRILLIEILDDYINNLIIQKASWITAIDQLKKLYNDNIPKKLQRSNDKVIRNIENYIALINLSLEDLAVCKIQNEKQENGQTENA